MGAVKHIPTITATIIPMGTGDISVAILMALPDGQHKILYIGLVNPDGSLQLQW